MRRPTDSGSRLGWLVGAAIALGVLGLAVAQLPAGPDDPVERSADRSAPGHGGSDPRRGEPGGEGGRHAGDRQRPRPGDRDRPGASAAAGIPPGATETVVTEVTDGDTVRLAGLGPARLIGVDTPEVYGGAECYGARASSYTKSRLAPGTTVRYKLGVEPRDRYGRSLVYVWLSGGTLFNAELVKAGYAVPLAIAPNTRYAPMLRRLAAEARARDRGLWAPATCGGNPDAPVHGRVAARPPGGDRDCADFSSQAAAQRYFERRGGPRRDPDLLDSDRDGVACEDL